MEKRKCDSRVGGFQTVQIWPRVVLVDLILGNQFIEMKIYFTLDWCNKKGGSICLRLDSSLELDSRVPMLHERDVVKLQIGKVNKCTEKWVIFPLSIPMLQDCNFKPLLPLFENDFHSIWIPSPSTKTEFDNQTFAPNSISLFRMS